MDELATKQDLLMLETNLKAHITEVLSGHTDKLNHALYDNNEKINNTLNKHIIEFTQEMSRNNVNMIWKVAGFLVAQAGVIVALIKLLP